MYSKIDNSSCEKYFPKLRLARGLDAAHTGCTSRRRFDAKWEITEIWIIFQKIFPQNHRNLNNRSLNILKITKIIFQKNDSSKSEKSGLPTAVTSPNVEMDIIVFFLTFPIINITTITILTITQSGIKCVIVASAMRAEQGPCEPIKGCIREIREQ